MAVTILATLGAACSSSRRQTSPSSTIAFPHPPPIVHANPSIRHPVIVRVPTKLAVERSSGTLSVRVSRDLLSFAKITVGSKMVTGVQEDVFVYPLGEVRPPQSGRSGMSGGGIDFGWGEDFWNSTQDGIPVPGQKYVVGVDLAIFETDIPAQHMWDPHSEKFKILWRRTLKQIVE